MVSMVTPVAPVESLKVMTVPSAEMAPGMAKDTPSTGPWAFSVSVAKSLIAEPIRW